MLDEITQMIENNITELIDGQNLFKNYYPDEPNNIVTVIAMGGFPPDKYNVTRELTFEVKLRSETYHAGNNLGNQILELFHSKENYSLGSFFILHSYALSELSYLYSDSKNRDEFSLELSFLIQKI